jgi:hypothetical protein
LADDVETQIPDKASPANDNPTSQPAPQTVTQRVVEPPAPAQATVPVPPKAASDLKPAPEPAKSEPVKTVKPNSEASEKPASDKAAERKATAEEDKSQAKEKPRKYLLQVAAVNSKAKADDLKNQVSKRIPKKSVPRTAIVFVSAWDHLPAVKKQKKCKRA